MLYLGTLEHAGSDLKLNSNTAAPFVIPKGTYRLWVQPSTTTFMVSCTGKNDSFSPTTAQMAKLGAADSLQEVSCIPGGTIASRKTDAGAGTLKVFAAVGGG
jgi:hypothetical protein